MASLEVIDVGKRFGDGEVLRAIGFAAQDGELVSLLGPSGCGKTTLLRIVAGLERADAGTVRLGGKDVTQSPPKQRDVAMVFQSYALYPHLSVEQNLALGLRLHGVPAAERARRIAETAAMLELSPLLKRKPAALSGGQRQRVALGRALVRRPQLTLLDEPLSNLDAVLRERTRAELKLLFKRVGATALYVTHDQVEAMTLSDRIVVLDRGCIQQIGTPEQIYREPANAFVAAFVGAPAMNLIPLPHAVAAGLVAPPAPGASTDGLVGVRPEELELCAQTRGGFTEYAVRLREPTGAQTVLTLQAGGVSLRATVPTQWSEQHARLFVRAPPERLHFFDAAGRRTQPEREPPR